MVTSGAMKAALPASREVIALRTEYFSTLAVLAPGGATTESKASNAIDFYLSLSGSLGGAAIQGNGENQSAVSKIS